jgi:hypothetical protein
MKLKKEELIELNKRNELVNEHLLTAQALDLQKRFWLNGKLEKMGLDSTKQYSIDNKNGAIIETKDEPKKD